MSQQPAQTVRTFAVDSRRPPSSSEMAVAALIDDGEAALLRSPDLEQISPICAARWAY